VQFAEDVWWAIFAYEAYPLTMETALTPQTRRKLMTAQRSSSRRAITFTTAEADELEAWLRAVVNRADAPQETADALATLRHARRLAE
jgi:hypothetical protein